MREQFRARRLAAIAALALTAILPACGGGGGGGTTPTTLPPAPQPVRTQILSGPFSLAAADRNGFPDIGAGPVTISGLGTVEIVADWTFASNDVDIIWYAGSCSSTQAIRDQCTILARTTSVSQKPERLTITNVAAGTYSVGLANYGSSSESGNYQVFLTR